MSLKIWQVEKEVEVSLYLDRLGRAKMGNLFCEREDFCQMKGLHNNMPTHTQFQSVHLYEFTWLLDA